MSDLNRELEALLRESGADLVGFADMRGVPGAELPLGIAVGVKLPPQIVRSISDGPSLAYHDAYHDINARLDRIVTAGAEFLTNLQYQAAAHTTKAVVRLDNTRTLLPHKTVAIRAGLGWIGRCAMLVTQEYGSAVRLSALLTDAPLDCARPVDESSCGDCAECVRHCPASAVTGEKWSAGMERERLMNASECRETARKLSFERFGKEVTLCGKCIEVCPYTRRYLRLAEG